MFRILVAVSYFSSALAFTGSAATRTAQNSLRMLEDRSKALPFDKRPPNLDGTLPGDKGFDPAGFSNNPPRTWLIGGESNSLKWYREAEIVHGRVAQLAFLGIFFPYLYHFQGNPAFGVPLDAYSKLNPYEALTSVPASGLIQISLLLFVIEVIRINRVIRGDKAPGDLGLGQGGFNPFGFNYTPEEYFKKQAQELEHGRTAMFGIIGLLLQAKVSGVDIVTQLSGGFVFPDERAPLIGPGTLNDYFPSGL